MLPRLIQWLCPIRRAVTPEEKHAVQRLRYQIYVNELKKRHLGRTDPAGERLIDAEDDRTDSAIFYAGPSASPTGAIRVDVYAPGSVPAAVKARYAVERMPEVASETVSELCRFTVAGGRRRTLIGMALGIAAYQFAAIERRSRFGFAYAAPGLVRSYRKFGFRPYAAPLVSTADGIRVPLISISTDLEYFKRYRSPLCSLASACRRLHGAGDAGGLKDRLGAAAAPVDVRLRSVTAAMDKLRQMDSPVVRGLSRKAMSLLCRYAVVIRLREGEHLLRAGLLERELYVVTEGGLEVRREPGEVALVGPGEPLGEVGLFRDSGLRSADVYARAACELVMLGRRFVDDLCATQPAMALRLMRNLAGVMAERMTALLDRLERSSAPSAQEPAAGSADRMPAFSGKPACASKARPPTSPPRT